MGLIPGQEINHPTCYAAWTKKKNLVFKKDFKIELLSKSHGKYRKGHDKCIDTFYALEIRVASGNRRS